jgi:hypothetical protein
MLMAHLNCFDRIFEDRLKDLEVEKKQGAESKKVLL